MAKNLVFSILKDELIVKEGRFIRFHGRPGLFIKVGKLIDGNDDKVKLYAVVFDLTENWTEEKAKNLLVSMGLKSINMINDDISLPDYKNGEFQKVI